MSGPGQPKEALEVTIEYNEGIATVSLNGELDNFTAPLLQNGADEALEGDGLTRLLLDASQLGYLDSTGLRTIIDISRLTSERKIDLAMRNPSPNVTRMLEITGLIDHITLEESNTISD